MKFCCVCKQDFDDSVTTCTLDGQLLVNEIILDDKYCLIKKLGEGGMGRVYLATHTHIGTNYAIKTLNPSLVSDKVAVERFRREARACAQIQHPNAVLVTDFGVDKVTGIVYLVMEYLKGMTLREKLNSKEILDYQEIASILREVSLGIHAAHTKGIIHRDLKPDNIFLAKNEESNIIKVLDFGIAKLKQSGSNTLTDTGAIVGTPHYMSPEQCGSLELDIRSDVYSLGIILYQMLTGALPFSSSTPLGIIMAQVSQSPPPFSKFCSNVPNVIEKVVMRALEKEAKKRQQTVMELTEEFETAVNSLKAHKNSSSNIGLNRESLRSQEKYDNADYFNVTTPLSTKISTQENNIINTQEVIPFDKVEITLLKRLATKSTTINSHSTLLLVSILLVLVISVVWFEFFNDSTELTFEMIKIEGGKFIMGDNNSDDKSEKPEYAVTIKAFYIDKYEVTNEEYNKFVTSTNYGAPWPNGVYPVDKANYPVVGVSWTDAAAYARWAGKRLPTEEEWEYAAHGSNRSAFPWGNSFDAKKYLNTKESGVGKLLPVGTFPAGQSPFGVFDLAGNAAEWTASDYQLYPGSKATIQKGKIVRGGSFNLTKDYAKTTARSLAEPSAKENYIGFRCARDINE